MTVIGSRCIKGSRCLLLSGRVSFSIVCVCNNMSSPPHLSFVCSLVGRLSILVFWIQHVQSNGSYSRDCSGMLIVEGYATFSNSVKRIGSLESVGGAWTTFLL